ncbi:MAG: tetratricopeptide repeat protein [Rhodospirillales bacterium]|nr:tetratricopeptide repeat protein [Rhodospirillales bacterium]
MTHSPGVSALRVSNEAFLVASTIERCPKTMMLRELVMNALEAADQGVSNQGQVSIDMVSVDRVPKLRIWNTGRGMSADELYRMCDLASSLHKQTGLDRNFGMGAKVASLPSNKHGLRYRSCRDGVVSQAVLGQREGIYGRLLQEDPRHGDIREILDVTEACHAEGCYDLSEDWTEVVLLGNHPAQDTALSPYDGNPPVRPDWISTTLIQRFFRISAHIRLTISASVSGSGQDVTFTPVASRIGELTRVESVQGDGGIIIHYGYSALQDGGTAWAKDGVMPIAGMAAIVHRGEMYGLREGASWVTEAPSYGFPFAARHCTVFIELPDGFGVRAEAYRQFLRFIDGDQRQVMLGDFATLVRAHIPGWLREIIASYGPPEADYVGEVRLELQELLSRLGVAPLPRATRTRGAIVDLRHEPRDSVEQRDKPPSVPRFEKAPEIITLRQEVQLAERGIQGRIARYYPEPHQLFVNATYPAIGRMQAELYHDFETAPDPERAAIVAAEIAEWAITRKVARGLVYGLSKKGLGWNVEELNRAQSPESLSILADDYAMLMPGARRRMAEQLGITLPAIAEDTPVAAWGRNLAHELADAKQAASRATTTTTTPINAALLLRRVSEIEVRRHNNKAALEWAHKAIAYDVSDPASHGHLAGLLQQAGDLDGAEEAVRTAIGLSQGAAQARWTRQLSSIVGQRGDLEAALNLARQAVALDPREPSLHQGLAGLLQQVGELDEAEKVLRTALAVDKARNPVHLLRQLSTIAAQRGQLEQAVTLARQAVEADPHEPTGHQQLAAVLQQSGNLEAAERAARAAVQASGPANPGRFLRQLSAILAQRGALTEALTYARQAVEAEPQDSSMHHHLAAMLQQGDYLEEAEASARAALRCAGAANPARFLRQLSSIVAQRGAAASALHLAREAAAADPRDPWPHNHLGVLLQQAGELDEAEAEIRMAMQLATGSNPGRFLRQLSTIMAQRSQMDPALALAQQAIVADPADPWSHNQLARLLQHQGDLDGAERETRTALHLCGGVNEGALLRQLSGIMLQRRQSEAALDLARQAVASNSKDPWSHYHLAGILQQGGDLDAALNAAERALELAPLDAKIRQRRNDFNRQRVLVAG